MTSEPIKSDIQEEVQKRLDNLAWIEAIIGGTLIVTPKNNFIIKIIYYQNLKKQWD